MFYCNLFIQCLFLHLFSYIFVSFIFVYILHLIFYFLILIILYGILSFLVHDWARLSLIKMYRINISFGKHHVLIFLSKVNKLYYIFIYAPYFFSYCPYIFSYCFGKKWVWVSFLIYKFKDYFCINSGNVAMP